MVTAGPEEPPSNPEPSRPSQTSIATIANLGLLETVWKQKIRKGLRSATLRDFYLAQDPVQFAAYEWGLKQFLARLSDELTLATYNPEPAAIVRVAKSQGLSRPFALMSPRDALVYRTLVMRAEPDLKRDLRKWTGAFKEDAGRLAAIAEAADAEGSIESTDGLIGTADAEPARGGRDTRSPDNDDSDAAVVPVSATKLWLDFSDTGSYDDDWFRVWLGKQGIVRRICDKCDYIVESDIANFFTAVDLEVVREHLHSHTSLDKEAVRLCVAVVRRTLPHPLYADSPTMGLPQEGFDSSRAIAHSLLVEVDRQFDDEGQQLIYSRFMDDFAIGARSIEDGHRIIARLQRSLEPLGLYPNTAKTRVITTKEYLRESMADDNAWLERVETDLKKTESGALRAAQPAQGLVDELVERFRAHRSLVERPKRWDRVLRRYYGVLRRVGVGDFVEEAIDDLADFPDSATNLLEYVRSFPLDPQRAEELLAAAVAVADLYGNIPLLALEVVASAPNRNDQAEHDAIARIALQLAESELANNERVERTLSDRIVAATVPIVGKFGDAELQARCVERLVRACAPKSHSRIQAAVLGLALEHPDVELMARALPGLPWHDVLALQYLRALDDGEHSPVGVALNLLRPEIRLMPNRFHVHARPLMFLPIVHRVAPKKVQRAAQGALKVLARNPAHLRDHRAEWVFEQHADA